MLPFNNSRKRHREEDKDAVKPPEPPSLRIQIPLRHSVLPPITERQAPGAPKTRKTRARIGIRDLLRHQVLDRFVQLLNENYFKEVAQMSRRGISRSDQDVIKQQYEKIIKQLKKYTRPHLLNDDEFYSLAEDTDKRIRDEPLSEQRAIFQHFVNNLKSIVTEAKPVDVDEVVRYTTEHLRGLHFPRRGDPKSYISFQSGKLGGKKHERNY